jgi:hypothetical protein
MLKAFLGDLIQDEDIWKAFQDHPAIRELALKQRKLLFRTFDDFPSYIPEKTFALVIANLTLDFPQDAEGHIGRKLQVNDRLGQLLDTILMGVRNSPAHALDRIQTWYTEALQRVTGRYTRRANGLALLVAAALTIGFNIDTVQVAKRLWQDKDLRIELAVKAQTIDEASAKLGDLSLPIGWPIDPNSDWGSRIAGWAVSALAIQLGAPFWFDLLSRFSRIRQAEAPPPK